MNTSSIIPIRVERRTPNEAKVIEWMIHNVCNYDCTFCGLPNKNGTDRWLTLEEYKIQDPIEHVLATIRENNFATEAEIEYINVKIKAMIDDAVEFAENSPYPDVSEVYKDIYTDENYPYIID